MTERLDGSHTLLYEGYALYPYTPGATKNATPTPFGIVYPPVYAAGGPHTFDRARMQLVLEPGGRVAATLAFLEPSGERHRASSGVEPTAPRIEFAFDAVQGRVRLADDPARGRAGARGDVRPQHDAGRRGARSRRRRCASSLRSTHLVAPAPGGRFASPIAPGPTAAAAVAECDHVNIFPVLASDDDDTVLGATIVLPDHPQIAPESHGDLFDATEIEEALLLHVLALSDAERAAIAEQDPKVREMLARAEAAGPEDIARLHGRVTVTDPPPAHRPARPTSPARRRSRSAASPTGAAPRCGCARASAPRRRTACGPAAWRRSSGSTATTRTASTWRSPSTTIPARS